MPYCLKCGSEVEETNTFCPNCGTRLKDFSSSMAPSIVPRPQVKTEENEKPKKPVDQQKGKKQEKTDHGFVKYLVAGLIMITVGVSAILKLQNPKFPTGELLAIMLFTIGLIVILAAVYVAVAGRKHTSSKSSDVTSEKPPVPPPL